MIKNQCRYALTLAMSDTDMPNSANPDKSTAPPAKLQPSSKAALARLADSMVEYPPLSPLSFVPREGDDLSLLTVRGTLEGTSTVIGPEPQSAPADDETWRLKPLPPLPKPEKRRSLLLMGPLSAPAIARRMSPFLTRAMRPRQQKQDSPSGSSAAGPSNFGTRSAPVMSSPSRQGRSRRVASDGGVRLAGGPPGQGMRYEGTNGVAVGLPPPYGAGA